MIFDIGYWGHPIFPPSKSKTKRPIIIAQLIIVFWCPYFPASKSKRPIIIAQLITVFWCNMFEFDVHEYA